MVKLSVTSSVVRNEVVAVEPFLVDKEVTVRSGIEGADTVIDWVELLLDSLDSVILPAPSATTLIVCEPADKVLAEMV